ncbi:hypothetical protein Q5H92_19290 [Hymenobacter sp. M29]|uniref:Uncharacterized protein n=1 Tax=Hymenobacter mellowenesis TaxID=3063995 RepID=A0ABT9AF82_9BACT|nr:hypothetical protein [Hymenobacter sp. M29]MDO7848520.1 hypothetical protein [Hymenobacter sp. M29]
MKIFIPYHHLPLNTRTNYTAVEQYFAGRLVDIEPGPEGLQLHLSWPDYAACYVDPDLEQGLAWWRHEMPVRQLPLEWVRRNNYQLSLNDNWTLYAWSQWLTRRLQGPGLPEEVVILHVDDHRDCMSPLLFRKQGNQYTDALSSKPVNLLEPATVQQAIESGAIAVGSFMPPFLHQLPQVQLRHLIPSHRLATAFPAGYVAAVDETDALLCPTGQRPAVEFSSTHPSGRRYFPTAELDEFLAEIPPHAAVLLHVDMDYFNNRYDGDSEWYHQPAVHNPPARVVYERISEVFSRIITAVPCARLEDITVALSPGFFPAEFWEQGVELVDRILSSTHD